MNAELLVRDMELLDRHFIGVADEHFRLRLRHDLASIAKLDSLFFQGPLRKIAQDDFRNVSVMLAAYLGETIRGLAGTGTWVLDPALGPCVVNLPGIAGSARVLARAERRIRLDQEAVLLPFVLQLVSRPS